jgi:putative SOS response-associated peptidase YedK
VRANDADERELVTLRWGLAPNWAPDLAIGGRMINARADTVAEKPAYRNAFKKRRCLVLADGFYEWRKDGKSKQPYFIRLKDGRPFCFAGLWERWSKAAGKTTTIAASSPTAARSAPQCFIATANGWVDSRANGGYGRLCADALE